MEVIRFADSQRNFAPGKDLRCVYTITEPDVSLSSHDWIGLFKEGWSHTRQYLAFEWAPREPKDEDTRKRRRRSVLFPSNDIQDLPYHFYQFVYVNRHDEVCGRSRTFTIGEQLPSPSLSPDLSPNPSFTVPLDLPSTDQTSTLPLNNASLENMPVENVHSDHSNKSLLGFEVVSSRSSSEEEVVFVDHVDVVNSMEHISHHGNIVNEIEDAINWDLLSVHSAATPDKRQLALVHVRKEDLALVPVDKNKKALVPYRSPDEAMTFVYNAASAAIAASNSREDNVETKEKQNVFDMTPVSTRYFRAPEQQPSTSPTILTNPSIPVAAVPPMITEPTKPFKRSVKQPTKCRRCRQLQARLRRALVERDSAQAQQREQRKDQESKDIKVDLMSSRIRNLLRENSRLQQQQATLIEEHRLRLQTEVQATAQDRDILRNNKEHLESELEELKKQNEELNIQLDNILYSLSVQGVSGIKDNQGKILDLSCIEVDPARPPLSAEGWKVARSRREERLVHGLRQKEQKVTQLSQQCQQLEQQRLERQKSIDKMDKQLEGEKETVEVLQKNLVQMDGQLYDLKQHIIVLKDMLDKEEKQSKTQAEESERKEATLQAQISHLSHQLREAQQHKTPMFSDSPMMTVNIPPAQQPTAMEVTEEKPSDLPSMCLDDPAIISATWSQNSDTAPLDNSPRNNTTPSYPVPLAGLFCNNPPPPETMQVPKTKPKKLVKKAKKLAPKRPVYYPVYEPMKLHPGGAVKESGLSHQPPTKMAAACESGAVPKKRKYSGSPPVEIKNHECSRCGMAFPKDCSQERMEKHKAMHRIVQA